MLFEVMVGEFHEGVPVVGGDVVLAGADAVADRALDQLVGGRPGHFGDGQAVGAQQAVDGVGRQGGQEFPFGVGPQVFLGRADQDRPRGDQGDQLVLVDRQLRLRGRCTGGSWCRTSGGRTC